MRNVSSSQSNNIESPKTPGGISKSLLTPCRRLGLSRNWKKGGPSPFISPLAGCSDVKQEKVQSRKRKDCGLEDDCIRTPVSSTAGDEIGNVDIKNINNNSTPSRNVELPRKKKSKTLLLAINETQAAIKPQSPIKSITGSDTASEDNDNKNISKCVGTDYAGVPTAVTSKSNSKNTSLKLVKEYQNEPNVELSSQEDIKILNNNKHRDEVNENDRILSKNKQDSPNELKKECMVVIQRKIFKTGILGDQMNNDSCSKTNKNKEIMTQSLFDSDSDDVPINNLIKRSELSQHSKDDFETVINKKKPVNKNPQKTKDNSKKLKNTQVISEPELIDTNTTELSEDDNDFAETKKTIIIRKTYAKVSMPSKAKSTGSISQKDIDELKARIEAKKKLLLAKAMTEDTKELRDLIKRWQKGCQDALMELMDLMKSKFPDKSNMDYSEILQTLQIPASLVGYNVDDDCFVTPDDTSIVLANFDQL